MRITRFLVVLLVLVGLSARAQREDSISVGNGSLHYYVYGTGEPILVLSGGPGISAHQEDDLAIHLSKTYQAILFDQRGTGNSWTLPMNASTINLNQAIEDLEILRKHLRIKQWNVTGHSWGAMLASAYIAKYPEHVKLFVVIGGGELSMTLNKIVSSNVNLRRQLSDTSIYDHWDSLEIAKKDSGRAGYEKRKLGAYALIYDRAKVDTVMKQVIRGEKNALMSSLMWINLGRVKFDVVAECKRFNGKVLVIFGWQDPIGLTTLSQYMAAFPDATVVGIDKSGHFPSVEQPVAFFDAIDHFLQKNLHE